MKNFIYLLLFAILCASCQEDDLQGKPPAVRNLENITNLRNELSSSPYGWKVIYFPKMDSLMFSNRNEILELNPTYKTNFGFGGHYFTMKFREDGTMEMLWDDNETTIHNLQNSEYSIRQNTYTQISFTTPNYIHKLVNNRYAGKSDFLYRGKDVDSNLVFRTASYKEPAREYMVFEKIKKAPDFQDFVEKSYNNRIFFQEMDNPQITIHRGSRIYFKSDMKIKFNTLDSEKELVKRMNYQRYYYFRFNKKPNYIAGGAYESTALGSGYVGTETGITFRPGIRYSDKYVFRDFERQGDKFVCELVKVYDPIYKIFRLVSKHLAPADAESTGYIAEIKIDKKS